MATRRRSGKARVRTHRIANLVSNGVAPWRILALPPVPKSPATRAPSWCACLSYTVPAPSLSGSSAVDPSLGPGPLSTSNTPTSSEGFPIPWSLEARRRQVSAPSTSDAGTAALVLSASKSSTSCHLPSLQASSTYLSGGPPVVGDDHVRRVIGPSVEMVKSMGGPGRLSRRNKPSRNSPKLVPDRNRSNPPRILVPSPDSPSPAAAATPAAAASVPGSVRKLPSESSSWVGG